MTEKKKTTKKSTAKKSGTKKKSAAKAVKANAPIVGDRPSNKKLDPKPKSPKSVPISPCDPAALICTVGPLGHIPFAPGTWCSLFALVFFKILLLLPAYVSTTIPGVQAMAIVAVAMLVLLYAIGVVAITNYQEKTGLKDAGEIVYDEFFGQTLAYSLIVAFYIGLAERTGVQLMALDNMVDQLTFLFVPFFMFRLFDIAKPWPVWVIDKKDNRPSGVMLDDVVAGIYAATASIVIFFLIG